MNSEKWKLTAYLAGYSKDFEYRRIAKEKYGDKIELIDPMTINWDLVHNNAETKLYDIWLINRDKKLIDKCDMVIANIEFLPEGEIMIGTLMEIMHAYHRGIPIFVISSQSYIRENPWLTFHIKKAFNTIDECFKYILK